MSRMPTQRQEYYYTAQFFQRLSNYGMALCPFRLGRTPGLDGRGSENLNIRKSNYRNGEAVNASR